MDKYQQQLFAAIASLDDLGEVKQFLTDLCSPAEINAMSERWRVVPAIKQGLSYRDIHQQTGVSVTTVGRVARSITYGEGGYELVYQRLFSNKS